MADDISVFLCKMAAGYEGILSVVRVGRASHTTGKSHHVLRLSILVHWQAECTIYYYDTRTAAVYKSTPGRFLRPHDFQFFHSGVQCGGMDVQHFRRAAGTVNFPSRLLKCPQNMVSFIIPKG